MYPHHIRLRGPWEWETVGEGAAPVSGRVTMPCRWADLGVTGRVRLRRRFGLPQRLDPHERVWLRFTGVAGTQVVSLNGLALSPVGDEFDVTAHLEPRNRLEVEMTIPAGDGRPWDEALLEIRCTAYLRDIGVRAEVVNGATRLRVTGRVAGAAEGPLELYLLCEDKTVGYAPVTAGEVLALVSDPLPVTPTVVRVELVCGAVVWHTLDASI